MANMRKKRCTNPACRRVYAYAPGGEMTCPWCREGSSRGWKTFRFGADAIPKLPDGRCRYAARLERLVTPRKLIAIKAYREALSLEGGAIPGLRESKAVIDGVCDGKPHTLTGLTARQVLLLMRKGEMDLYFRSGSRVSSWKRAAASAGR